MLKVLCFNPDSFEAFRTSLKHQIDDCFRCWLLFSFSQTSIRLRLCGAVGCPWPLKLLELGELEVCFWQFAAFDSALVRLCDCGAVCFCFCLVSTFLIRRCLQIKRWSFGSRCESVNVCSDEKQGRILPTGPGAFPSPFLSSRIVACAFWCLLNGKTNFRDPISYRVERKDYGLSEYRINFALSTDRGYWPLQ